MTLQSNSFLPQLIIDSQTVKICAYESLVLRRQRSHVRIVSGAPIKSGTSRFLTITNIGLGKHRVSTSYGFESLTVARLPATSSQESISFVVPPLRDTATATPDRRNALHDSSEALPFPGSRQFVPSAWRFGGRLIIIYISKFAVQKYGRGGGCPRCRDDPGSQGRTP